MPLNKCGKLVVARDASELPVLNELAKRAKVNGVRIEEISADEARMIERGLEHIRGHCGLQVDPSRVIASLVSDARREGIQICTRTAFWGVEEHSSSGQRVRPGATRHKDHDRFD